MASKIWLMFMFLAVVVVVVVESSSLDNGDWDVSHLSYGDDEFASVQSCHGRVGDCLANSGNMMMGHDPNHRMLLYGRKRHISYEAMRKDNVPCRQPGQSYYSGCISNIQANPYNRGCTFITHCARYLG